jgi:hypothetical protein
MGINAKLNDAGIPSPSQYKADHGIITNNNKKARRILWNKHVITDILSNSVYIGHLAQKKGIQCLYAGLPYHRTDADEWIIVKNTHEPLISEDLFNTVQSINQKVSETSKANSGKYDYLPKAINIYGKKTDMCRLWGGHQAPSLNKHKEGSGIFYIQMPNIR